MSSELIVNEEPSSYWQFFNNYTYNTGQYFYAIYQHPRPTLEFILARVPNIHESISSTFFQSSLESLVKYLNIEKLNELTDDAHPSSQLIFRNAVKFPGVWWAWYNGYELGSTGQFYDIGKVINSFTKPTCQVLVIAGGIFTTPLSAGYLGRISNILCEPLSRVLTLISRQNQKAHGHGNLSVYEELKQYINFLIDNVSKDLVWDAVETGIIKSMVSDMAGAVVQDPIKFAVKLVKLFPIFKFMPPMLDDYITNFIKGFIKTYMLTPTARTAEDFFLLIEKLKALQQQEGSNNTKTEVTQEHQPDVIIPEARQESSEDFCPAHSYHEEVENLGVCLVGEQPALVI